MFAYQSLKQLSYLCLRGVHSFAKLEAMKIVLQTKCARGVQNLVDRPTNYSRIGKNVFHHKDGFARDYLKDNRADLTV